MSFSATLDSVKLNRQLRKLSRGQQFAANSRALRRAQQSMRKAATKETQEVLNLRSRPIRDVVRTKRIGRRALGAEVRIIAEPQEIYDFKRTRQVKKGVSVQIKKRGGRRVIRGAFIATLRSGKTSVFRRRLNPATGRPFGRLPIDILFTTSVRQVFENRPRRDRVIEAGRIRYIRELRRDVQFRLAS